MADGRSERDLAAAAVLSLMSTDVRDEFHDPALHPGPAAPPGCPQAAALAGPTVPPSDMRLASAGPAIPASDGPTAVAEVPARAGGPDRVVSDEPRARLRPRGVKKHQGWREREEGLGARTVTCFYAPLCVRRRGLSFSDSQVESSVRNALWWADAGPGGDASDGSAGEDVVLPSMMRHLNPVQVARILRASTRACRLAAGTTARSARRRQAAVVHGGIGEQSHGTVSLRRFACAAQVLREGSRALRPAPRQISLWRRSATCVRRTMWTHLSPTSTPDGCAGAPAGTRSRANYCAARFVLPKRRAGRTRSTCRWP